VRMSKCEAYLVLECVVNAYETVESECECVDRCLVSLRYNECCGVYVLIR